MNGAVATLPPPGIAVIFERNLSMFRLRFSLKWLLLGTALAGLLAGTYGKKLYDHWYASYWLKRQATIAKELESAGCEVKMIQGRVAEVTIPANVAARKAMPWIAEATELEQLSIYCEPTDEDLLALGEHTKLRLLRLNGAATTERSLAVIGGLRRLENLWMSNPQLSDEELRHLSNLSELEYVEFSAGPKFTGQGLAYLAGLKKLKFLQLWQVHLIRGEALPQLQQVATLGVRQSRIEPGVLAQVAKMRNLKSLSLVQSNMDDDSLAGLKDARQLERIAFTAASVSDKGMVHLYDLKQLQQITVSMSKVTDAGAQELAEHLPETAITGHKPYFPKSRHEPSGR